MRGSTLIQYKNAKTKQDIFTLPGAPKQTEWKPVFKSSLKISLCSKNLQSFQQNWLLCTTKDDYEFFSSSENSFGASIQKFKNWVPFVTCTQQYVLYRTGCENSGKVFVDSASDQNSNYSVHFHLIHHLHDKKYMYLQLSVSLIFWEEDDSPFEYIYGQLCALLSPIFCLHAFELQFFHSQY